MPRVVGADGGDLGSIGTAELTLVLGVNKIKQHFIVCRELRRNIILGVDFAKQNCAGIQWTTNRTRILSLNGIKVVEVEEDELGVPVTASYHVRVPPRHNAVFEVNVHVELQETHVITGNQHLLEKHPNMYQHEMAIHSENNNEMFPLMAITNLNQVKTLHSHKGEVVGFAKPESAEVVYIATTNELNIEETIDVIPRNWIPKRKWNLSSRALQKPQETDSKNCKHSQNSQIQGRTLKLPKTLRESLQTSPPESVNNDPHPLQYAKECSAEKCEPVEHSQNSRDQQWCDISEVIDSDFLISPGDIYPNRKVELEDADIKETTREDFERLCEHQHEAFPKNN